MRPEIVFGKEEIEDIENAVKEEAPTLQECKNFFIVPNNESKTITIMGTDHNALLRLNKSNALRLAEIIQDCVRKL